jgi:hypothetical protein
MDGAGSICLRRMVTRNRIDMSLPLFIKTSHFYLSFKTMYFDMMKMPKRKIKSVWEQNFSKD